MSEKYYREINNNKDIVRFKLQLGAILLKLNEHNLSIENNDCDIKNNYDICTTDNNTLIDIDRKIYAINNNITKINSDIDRLNNKNITNKYSIENICFFNIDILNHYIISNSKPTVILYECEIESKFIVNSI